MNSEKTDEAINLEDSLLDDAELEEARGGADFSAFLGGQGSQRVDLNRAQLEHLQVLRPLRPIGLNASYIKEIITDKPVFDSSVLYRATNLLGR